MKCKKCHTEIKSLLTTTYCACDEDWWCTRCGYCKTFNPGTKDVPACGQCGVLLDKAVEFELVLDSEEGDTRAWDEVTQEIEIPDNWLWPAPDNAADFRLCSTCGVSNRIQCDSQAVVCSGCGKLA